MKNKLTILPVPKNRRHLGELFDAMKKQGVNIVPGDSLDEIIVEAKHQGTAEKILNIHGFQITKENNLVGAMEKLAEQFDFGQERPQLDEMNFLDRVGHEADKIPAVRTDKQTIRTYITRTLRGVRATRTKRRAQHVRDNIDGQITAYENILRYLKKL